MQFLCFWVLLFVYLVEKHPIPAIHLIYHIENQTDDWSPLLVVEVIEQCNHRPLKISRQNGNYFSMVCVHKPPVHISCNVAWSGVPRISSILSIWLKLSAPRNAGRSRISSAMIHPTDQTSTFSSYRSQLSKISGARHHLIETNSYGFWEQSEMLNIPSCNIASERIIGRAAS